MSYRVFRWLIIGAVVCLLSTLSLFFWLLFFGHLETLSFFPAVRSAEAGNRKQTKQLQQLIQQIASNQEKLISSNQELNKLLDIPQQQYDQAPLLLSALPSANSANSANNDVAQTEQSTMGFQALQPGKRNEAVAEKAVPTSPLEMAFYDALNYLERNLQQEKAWEDLNQLLESKQWQKLLAKNELFLERREEAALLFPANNSLLPSGYVASQWFRITVRSSKPSGSKNQNELHIQSSFTQRKYIGPLRNTSQLHNYIAEQSQKIYLLADQYYKMYQFLSDAALQERLAAKHLYIKSLQEASLEKVSTIGKRILKVAQTNWEVRTRDEQVLARFEFDIDQYQLLWNSKSYQSVQLLRSDWDIFINNVDTRTRGQRQEEQMRKYLQKMFADSAFLLQMQHYGLRPAALPPREDLYYEYYDLLNNEGHRMASFALQKRIGEAYLMDKDDVKIRGLKSFVTGAKDLKSLFGDDTELSSNTANAVQTTSDSAFQAETKNRPATSLGLASDSGTWSERDGTGIPPPPELILLIGTHDTMADVIMLVSINKETRTLHIISLPRDLYYQNAKINEIYSTYGPEIFMEVLSQIVGISIRKYLSIDMYAFIDVVDLIGGIDVYLPEVLIDPTYKIKQMGKWQTLVMRKGQHHLDGLGALRYSRSRYTTNDFDRLERQQFVLNQVAEKLRQVLVNPKKLLPLLQVLQKYMKTSFSSTEIASYWLKYGSYQRNFGNTINTDNVLYYTFTNYLGLNSEELAKAQDNENFFRGAFILLPRNNDWSLIRKHILRLQQK